MSTLPWQQNFAGLIGGIFFGMGLTFALVPFVNITKYNRKSKVSYMELLLRERRTNDCWTFQINLIWTCILLHLLLYAAMFVIFYVFPTLFSSLGFAGSHPNDHFTNGQPGHFDDGHINSNHNQNVFNGVINNYNTGGGIVSSIRSPPSQFHLKLGHKNY
jgi:hypothetical protein